MAGSTCHQLSGLSQYLNGAEAFFYCLLWIARMEVLCFPVSRSEGWMGFSPGLVTYIASVANEPSICKGYRCRKNLTADKKPAMLNLILRPVS